jgi:signal transduction histidine kinase
MLPPRFFDPSGSPLDPARGLPPWDPPAIARAAPGEETYSTVVYEDKTYRILSVGIPRPDGTEIVAQLAEPLSAVNQALAGLLRALLAMIPVGLIFAAIGGALLTDRALRPVRRIAHAAARVSAEDLSLRLPVAGADEFAEMSGTFNSMLDRIQHAFVAQQGLVEELTRRVERERRFTADVSHELRTPITIVKANAGLLANGDTDNEGRSQSIEDIEQAAERMSRLVQDLLLLARADVGQLARNRIVVPVCEVVDRAVNGLVGQVHAPVRVDISDPALCVIGDEDEMARLVGNLLENAARYTPADGAITVGAERTNGTAILRVTDTGVGIPAEHIPHLGERFYRVASDRSRQSGGSGLGLSICKGIAEAHHGSIAFESVLGKGTRVTVVLPAAPRAESPGPDEGANEE